MSLDYVIYGLLSLIPPVLIITLVLKTKNIKKSFLFGVLSAMLILPITNGVTSIVDYAFWYCSNLISAEIGESVSNIGNYSFRLCRSLKDIHVDPIIYITVVSMGCC